MGIEKFSTRNAAKRCGLSYNAPYKHFKNTEEYLAADSLVSEYCAGAGMSEEKKKQKLFAVRSFIDCAAFFFHNGQMALNDENLQMVRSLIEREFETD